MTATSEHSMRSGQDPACLRTAHDDILLRETGDADDWVAGRLHTIAHKVVAAEHAQPADATGIDATYSATSERDDLTLDDVRWLVQLLQRQNATVRQVHALWDEWYHHQNATIGEITLTARLHSALLTTTTGSC